MNTQFIKKTMTPSAINIESTLAKWGYNLLNAAVVGGATAGLSWLGLNGAHGAGMDVPAMNLKGLEVIFASGAISKILMFLSQGLPQLSQPQSDSQNEPASTDAPPSNTMKTPLIVILIALSVCLTSKAQTLDHVPDLLGTNSPITFNGALGQVWSAFTASSIMQATNYAIAPYATYAPKAPEKVGGGILAIYNVNDYVGAALGVDYLGSFSLVSGNVTLKADTQPLKTITWLSWAPDMVRNVTVTPFSLLGVGTPLGGTSGQGAATIWDVGGMVKFGHLFGGRFGAGATWGEWMNAGAYSGHRYHAFVDWQKGF